MELINVILNYQEEHNELFFLFAGALLTGDLCWCSSNSQLFKMNILSCWVMSSVTRLSDSNMRRIWQGNKTCCVFLKQHTGFSSRSHPRASTSTRTTHSSVWACIINAGTNLVKHEASAVMKSPVNELPERRSPCLTSFSRLARSFLIWEQSHHFLSICSAQREEQAF